MRIFMKLHTIPIFFSDEIAGPFATGLGTERHTVNNPAAKPDHNMTQKFKIAGVQMDVMLADPAANLERMKSLLAGTAGHGAMLTVFPECALTGYCFE